jgi:pyruvyltransferase
VADPLPLYWWRNKPNFGDALSSVLVSRLLGREVQFSTQTPKLLAIGSILQQYTRPGDVIWGTGAWFGHEDWSAKGITFLAVRGPLTRAYVLRKGGTCPELYGDPGLLLATIYPQTPQPQRPVVAMPHIDDDAGWNFAHAAGLPTINPGWDWQRVVDGILSAAHLVTSSLHGLIAAEAYGVPVTWAQFLPPAKFDDYFAGTGRVRRAPFPWKQAVEQRPDPLRVAPPAELLPALRQWHEKRNGAAAAG